MQVTNSIPAAATAPAPDDATQETIDRLVRQRGGIEASRPDLAGDPSLVWPLGGIVAGSMVGAGAMAVIEKIPGIPCGRHGGTLLGIMLGTGLVLGVGGAIGATMLGERITRPEGAEADAIRAAHEVKVRQQLAVIDRQLDALGYEPPAS